MNLKSEEQQEFEQIVKEWVQLREKPSEILETALEHKGKNLGLSHKVIEEIIKKEWQLSEELEEKRRIYEQAYAKAIELDFPVSDNKETLEELKFLQETLALRDVDVASIEKKYNTSWQCFGAEACFRRGFKNYESKNYEKAILNYNQAIELKRNYCLAYYNRGLAYYNLGKLEQAIEDYTQAIKIDNQWGTTSIAQAYRERGKAYYYLGTHKPKVIEDYNRAIKHGDNSSSIYFDLGKVFYYDLKNYTEAIKNYNNALERNKTSSQLEDTSIHLELGLAYYYSDQKQAALTEWTQATIKNSNYSVAFYNQGSVHEYNGDYQKAIDAYNKAIKVNGEWASIQPHYAYYRLGLSLSKLNRFKEAIDAYTKVINLDPEYDVAYEMRGDAYKKLGENDLANEDYQQAASLYQDLFKKESYSELLKKISDLG